MELKKDSARKYTEYTDSDSLYSELSNSDEEMKTTTTTTCLTWRERVGRAKKLCANARRRTKPIWPTTPHAKTKSQISGVTSSSSTIAAVRPLSSVSPMPDTESTPRSGCVHGHRTFCCGIRPTSRFTNIPIRKPPRRRSLPSVSSILRLEMISRQTLLTRQNRRVASLSSYL